MPTYSIADAKANLSRLIKRAANGESIIIAKSGKPMVKIVPLDAPATFRQKRFGFMADQIKAPDDFNTMGARKVQRLFEGK